MESGDLPQILAALLEQNKRAALRRAHNNSKSAKSGVKPRWRPPPGPAKRTSHNKVAAADEDDNATDTASAPSFSDSTSGTVGSPTVAGVQRSRILPSELTPQQRKSIYETLSVYTHGIPEKDLTPHQWFFVEAVEYCMFPSLVLQWALIRRVLPTRCQHHRSLKHFPALRMLTPESQGILSFSEIAKRMSLQFMSGRPSLMAITQLSGPRRRLSRRRSHTTSQQCIENAVNQ